LCFAPGATHGQIFLVLLNGSWSFDTHRTLVVVIEKILAVQSKLKHPLKIHPSDQLSTVSCPSFPLLPLIKI
jgi:hypothetical protein